MRQAIGGTVLLHPRTRASHARCYDLPMPIPPDLLDGLNPAQREAAGKVRGPVAILAGAGTGKTTTITHRIAMQVLSGEFSPRELLAVTFTDKAAGEMRARLRRLGVAGVETRTFHSAARWQLGVMWQHYTGEPLADVLPSKSLLLEPIVRQLPMPYKFRPRREFATEIEWAKNRRIGPGQYLEAIERLDHPAPVPADIMQKVYAAYEQRKVAAGKQDFEDMLGQAASLLEKHPEAAERMRARFLAFTVDEYQDVNPLQQQLLDLWLGDRDELCVVGDDYQTVYGFTGATPDYLLGMRQRFAHTHVVTLEDNYRSTAQVLKLANRLVPRLGGEPKTLRATREDGPAPTAQRFSDREAEAAHVVATARELHAGGIDWSQMAVLYRINARSQPFEDALVAAGIPYQVRDGSFLRRPGPRAALGYLRRLDGGDLLAAVQRTVAELGYDPNTGDASDEEATRQADLGRLVLLAREYAQTAEANELDATSGGFIAELEQRFHTEEEGRGLQLMTYHRAKGLEFDVVFLPHLEKNELPFKSRGSKPDVDGERRLLYVGLTRAKRHLVLSWSDAPSEFVKVDLALAGSEKQKAGKGSASSKAGGNKTELPDSPLFEELRAWRLRRAQADGMPAYVVFHNATLAEIAENVPQSTSDLLDVAGVGPAKVEKYGDDLLAAIGSFHASGSVAPTAG